MEPLPDPSPDEYDFIMYVGIDEIRALYSHICFAIEIWPGSPRRPAEEQEFLKNMRTRLFAMIADHAFTKNDTNE